MTLLCLRASVAPVEPVPLEAARQLVVGVPVARAELTDADRLPRGRLHAERTNGAQTRLVLGRLKLSWMPP